MNSDTCHSSPNFLQQEETSVTVQVTQLILASSSSRELLDTQRVGSL